MRISKFLNKLTMEISTFIKNIWIFRKELVEYNSRNYIYSLYLFRKSLELILHSIKNGSEMESNKFKKIKAIERLIFITSTIIENSFIDLAEKKLNKKMIHKNWKFSEPDEKGCKELLKTLTSDEENNNSEIVQESFKLEDQFWDEFARIIRGQLNVVHEENETEILNTISIGKCYKMNYDSIDRIYLNEKETNEKFDGTGMKNWWD